MFIKIVFTSILLSFLLIGCTQPDKNRLDSSTILP